MNLLGLLVDKDLLSVDDRRAIEADVLAKRPLAEALADHGVVLADALAEAGKIYGLPTRILGDPPAAEESLGYIPIDSARHYGFVPLDVVDGALEVGITDPDNIEAFDALQFISGKIGMPYVMFLITTQDFDRVIEAYQNFSGEIGKAISEYETTAKPTTPAGKKAAAQGLSEGQGAIGLEEELNLAGPHETLKED